MAKIRSVELIEFEHVVRRTHSGTGQRLPAAEVTESSTRRFAVSITDEDGATGSYVALWSAPPLAIAQVRVAAQLVVGLDAFDRELIWDRGNSRLAKGDRIGFGAVDIALWDLAGRRLGVPISALLGRFRDRLPAYASTVGGGHGLGALAGPDTYRDFAKMCADRGFRGFKLHGPGTGDVADEIAVLRASAEGAGGRMDIMTDPGNGLRTLADALKLGRVCDEIGAFWWEDPMRDNSSHGHRILRERIKTPLLLTEHVRGLEMRMASALEGATDFLRADPELDMGITGVMKTAHAAEAIGIDMEVHAAGPAQRHCMAAIRNTNYYELGLLDPETGNPQHPPVYADGYCEDADAVGPDGCVAVPDGPGLGVEYDWDFLNRNCLERTVFT